MDEAQGIQVLRQKYPNEISLGFTGTRTGMTTSQWSTVERIMRQLFQDRKGWFHDGDCLGADAQAYALAAKLKEGGADLKLVGHPCNILKWRAFNNDDVTHTSLPPLVRNREIVRNTVTMIAAPGEYDEQWRGSGTWATIRVAQRLLRPLFICWPDGTVKVQSYD